MNTVRIYALTDSHQESRKLAVLLSGIYEFEKNYSDKFIVLDCGDLFKGIYEKDLSVNTYINFKKKCSRAEICITPGNNDFGFYPDDMRYLEKTIKLFKEYNINVISANLYNLKDNTPSELIPKYKILEINNHRILITGFCLNTSVVKSFGLKFEPAQNCLKTLIEEIKEPYDKTIVLNHHWYNYSLELKKYAQNNNIPVDLIIGGHEHSRIDPDYENNIFYPLAFGKTLYKMTIDDKVNNIKEISQDELKILPEFEAPIKKYETETELFKPLAKRVLNLWKAYSNPCPLGTFISDKMKETGKTDIAFHSTGFTMYPLRLEDSNVITKYDFERVICASTSIVKTKFSAGDLKKIFENATLNRMYKTNGNARFLQCSGNITITGKGNSNDKTYKIIQIEINGEKLLDETQNPVNKDKKYSCTLDSFIAGGEQGYSIMKNFKFQKIIKKGKEVQLNKLLLEALKEAPSKYSGMTEYPAFKIIDT